MPSKSVEIPPRHQYSTRSKPAAETAKPSASAVASRLYSARNSVRASRTLFRGQSSQSIHNITAVRDEAELARLATAFPQIPRRRSDSEHNSDVHFEHSMSRLNAVAQDACEHRFSRGGQARLFLNTRAVPTIFNPHLSRRFRTFFTCWT